MPKSRDLTVQQQRFADGVLAGKSGREAYESAGYKARGASIDANASRLLNNAKVAAYIASIREKVANKLEITQERVLKELARIAFADVRNLFTWDEERSCYVPSADLTDDQAAAISAVKAETTRFMTEDGEREVEKVKLELRTYDKLGALEKIAKHLGMLVEKSENRTTGEITVRFIHE